MEFCLHRRKVLAVRAVNHVQHKRAIFHGAANRPQLVHRPAQRHGPGSRHHAKARPQTGIPTARRRRRDRAQRLRSDRKSNAPRSYRASRAGRRPARSLLWIPRVPRSSAKPLVAHRQRTQRELRDQNRSRLIQTLHHGRVFFESSGARILPRPTSSDNPSRQQVLRAPRNPMQRSAIKPRRDLLVRSLSLQQRPILQNRDHEV